MHESMCRFAMMVQGTNCGLFKENPPLLHQICRYADILICSDAAESPLHMKFQICYMPMQHNCTCRRSPGSAMVGATSPHHQTSAWLSHSTASGKFVTRYSPMPSWCSGES